MVICTSQSNFGVAFMFISIHPRLIHTKLSITLQILFSIHCPNLTCAARKEIPILLAYITDPLMTLPMVLLLDKLFFLSSLTVKLLSILFSLVPILACVPFFSWLGHSPSTSTVTYPCLYFIYLTHIPQ